MARKLVEVRIAEMGRGRAMGRLDDRKHQCEGARDDHHHDALHHALEPLLLTTLIGLPCPCLLLGNDGRKPLFAGPVRLATNSAPTRGGTRPAPRHRCHSTRPEHCSEPGHRCIGFDGAVEWAMPPCTEVISTNRPLRILRAVREGDDEITSCELSSQSGPINCQYSSAVWPMPSLPLGAYSHRDLLHAIFAMGLVDDEVRHRCARPCTHRYRRARRRRPV